MIRSLLVSVLLAGTAFSQGIITTFAGSGAAGFSGDGGPATAASFNRSVYVHIDVFGNVYVADENNQRVRKIDAQGVITTFAGSGAQGFSGDGGPATAASLNGPNGVCSDADGNIYIDDTLNQRIRKVDRNGVITTFAGNGSTVSGGDGGAATAAGMWLPIRCDFDAQGNMYIAEQGGHKVRKVSTNGIVSTIAGTGAQGFSGDGGPGTAAMMNNPTAVAVDYAGNVYVSDQSNHRIRRITPGGTISTFAGTGAQGFSGDNGPATAATLPFPNSLATDQSGTLYITEGVNQRIRRVTPDGVISTIAGTGVGGFSGDNGPATAAMINAPFGIDVDRTGAILFADTFNNRIRKISPLPPVSAPQFTSEESRNAASFVTGFTPGGLATIFGSRLSPTNGFVIADEAPWPTSLNGVSVSVNGAPARLYSLVALNGKEQISFQVPFEATGSEAQTIVTNNGSPSAAVNVPLIASQPGIFIIDGVGNGAFLHANFDVVTAANPALRGEVVLLYLTGLGAVNQPIATGSLAPSAPPFPETIAATTVTVGGIDATPSIIYNGLAPNLISLYQINFTVPPDSPAGSVDVVVTSGGVASNVAKLEVR